MSDVLHGWKPLEIDVVEAIPAGGHAHCTACFKSYCDKSATGDGACLMIACRECHVSMHGCKAVDHQFICPKAIAPCINAQYGCEVKMRRDRSSSDWSGKNWSKREHFHAVSRLGAHLEFCVASTIACVYTWNREFIDIRAKKELKRRLAAGELKTLVVSGADNSDDLDLDIQLALSDQHMLERYYTCRREFRRHERDGRIPMQLDKADRSMLERYAKGQRKRADEIPTSWVDSSEAEEREMERNVRVKKGAFADCYLCRSDPGSQHLHVLGNMATASAMAAAENAVMTTESETSPSSLDDPMTAVVNMLTANSLYLKLDIAFAGAISQLRTPGMRRIKVDQATHPCVVPWGEVVRRDEFHAHQLYHQRVQELLDGRYVRRCPMWQDGCTFRCCQLKPLEGKLKVNTFVSTDAVQWEPMPDVDADSMTDTSRDIPMQILRNIEPHLDSASLRCLAGTCRKLRATLFTHFSHRLAAELKWRRVLLDDAASVHWLEDGVERTFTAAHSFPPANKWVWEPAAQLSDHLAHCEYKRPMDYAEANGRLDLRLYHGDVLPPNEDVPYFGNLFESA